MRTVSYVNGTWSWADGYQRDPGSRIMQTLLPSFKHTIWNTTHGLGELWTWVFLQSRAPAARSIFSAARFNTTPAQVNQAYADTLATKVTAPRAATFTRDVKGPAWLKVAPDGTLSGTPGVADLGINTWDITVNTTDANNLPITETSELILFVEAPGYNEWWQQQNGYTDLSVAAIQSGPAGDDDGDGLTNYFEYVTGSDPLLHTSDTRRPASTPYPFVASFNCSIAPATGDPSKMQITYGPLIAGTTYTVKSSNSLTSGQWSVVGSSYTPNSAETTKTISFTMPASTTFYTVAINKP